MKPRQGTMTKLSRIGESDREFDLTFWQSLPPSARMAAFWDMTVFHHKLKKRPPDELRLNRTIATLRPREY